MLDMVIVYCVYGVGFSCSLLCLVVGVLWLFVAWFVCRVLALNFGLLLGYFILVLGAYWVCLDWSRL